MESALRQLQLKCLEILDIVVKICREHDIKYSLCSGSVLGAHLYKGFLPWDDDIDIMMTRDNYNKCKRIQTINTGKKTGSNINNWLRNLSLSTILSNRRKYLMFFQKVAVLFGKHSKHYTYRELYGAYHDYNMVPYKPSIFDLQTRITGQILTNKKKGKFLHTMLNLPYKEYIKQQSI